MLRAFFGHHKSASTWVRGMLRDVAVAMKLDILTIFSPKQLVGYPSLGALVEHEKPDIVSLGNAAQEDVDTLPELRGFHVIRDPRDIIVSGYFHHLHSHREVVNGIVWDELPPHRKRLRELDHDEGLMAQIEFSYPYIHTMATWNYQQPGVLEVKMEDLVTEPLKRWTQICTHLDLLAPEGAGGARLRSALTAWNLSIRRRSPPAAAFLRGRLHLPRIRQRHLPSHWLPDALDFLSFERLSGGRTRGEEDPTHMFRRGVPGDWRNHLNAKHLEAIRARHGDLVERLGYEW